jgi:S1-C subfamily serine protease
VRTHDGRTLEATVSGRDDTRDLALLAVPGLDGSPLPPASEPVAVGDLVVGTWRNWHGEPAASLGVVGAIGGPVRIGRRATIERIIRADIGSTRGISGSPLVNAAGQIVGILNAGVARGVPLALPIDEVERSVQALAVHGRIRRGFLGLALQPVALPSRQHASGDALLVVGVEAGGPADQAGLLVGDIVVAAAGEPTPELDTLHRWLGGDRIGSSLELDVLRGTIVERIAVVIGERSAAAR